MISERELISKIRQAAGSNTRLIKGIGDDCAVLTNHDAGKFSLISLDTLVEGVHFDLAWHSPEDLGHKAAAVNISDIAAMGGKPTFALLSIAAPATTRPAWLDKFMSGFMAELAKYQITLVGGDTVASREELYFSVTILGEAVSEQVLYRSGASAGDVVMVSGFLGDAALGLEICRHTRSEFRDTWPALAAAHLTPVPETALGQLLAGSGMVTAMLDMSDGLATDLAHLCEASGLGAEVDGAAIPLSAAACQAAEAMKLDVLRVAVTGGEDYRLLFTCAARHEEYLRKIVRDALGRQLFQIGKMVPGSGVHLYVKGKMSNIDFQGYDAFGVTTLKKC